MRRKPALAANALIVLMELAVLYQAVRDGFLGSIKYYTIDSNLLQLAASCAALCCLLKKDGKLTKGVARLRFLAAACLAVTMVTVLTILAPQHGYKLLLWGHMQQFSHLLCPLLSMISLIFFEAKPQLPARVIWLPGFVTLGYGAVLIALNLLRLVDGPYFFLKVYNRPVSETVLWILGVLAICAMFSALLFLLRRAVGKRRRG